VRPRPRIIPCIVIFAAHSAYQHEGVADTSYLQSGSTRTEPKCDSSKRRDEAPKALVDMLTLAACQQDTEVKVLQTDNSGPLTSRWFEDGIAKLGIKQNLSFAYMHETNGIAERFNQTITGSARTLLFDSCFPLSLWGEALTHAVYTKN